MKGFNRLAFQRENKWGPESIGGGRPEPAPQFRQRVADTYGGRNH